MKARLPIQTFEVLQAEYGKLAMLDATVATLLWDEVLNDSPHEARDAVRDDGRPERQADVDELRMERERIEDEIADLEERLDQIEDELRVLGDSGGVDAIDQKRTWPAKVVEQAATVRALLRQYENRDSEILAVVTRDRSEATP